MIFASIPILSWPELSGVALVAVALLLSVGFLMFKRLVGRGLAIVDAFPAMASTVEALQKGVSTLPSKDFFERCYAALETLGSHTKRLDRQEYDITNLIAKQEKGQTRLDELSRHTEFVLKKLEDIDDHSKEQTVALKGITARLAVIEYGMGWDGKTERRR